MSFSPSGATHYIDYGDYREFYKIENNEWQYYDSEYMSWQKSSYHIAKKENQMTRLSEMKECPRHGGSYDTSRHDQCPCLDRFEQPKPTGDGERVVPMVMNDLITRMEKGITTYDKALSINNGRDALQDAYEEALDLACYLRQLIEERK